MNWNRMTSLLLACVAVCGGLVYLYVGSISLGWVLPGMCVCFGGIAVLSFRDAHASGMRGLAAALPAVAAGLMSLIAFAGWIVYLAS